MKDIMNKLFNKQSLTNDELLTLIDFLFTNTSVADTLYEDILAIYYKRKKIITGRWENGKNTKANS